MKAYKFTNEAFYKKASFRLGTLYDYRNQELHGDKVGDSKEGSFNGQFDYQTDFKISDDEIKELTSKQDFDVLWVRGHTQNKEHDFLSFTVSNLLIFSASLIYDEQLFEEFDNSDLCYEITDFDAFSKEIIRNLKLPIKKWAIKQCTYEDKETLNSYSAIPSIAFLKEKKYRAQQEIRLCIELAYHETQPIILKNKKALKYCKRKKLR